jgi:DNA phosphorothioation-dependent restriction protein DptG
LNYLPIPDAPHPITYIDLKKWTDNADPVKKSGVMQKLDDLIYFYKESIANLLSFEWDNYNGEFESDEDDPILRKTRILWKMINCQFRESDRNAPAGRYSKWLSLFANKNFIKRRGRIGYTLSLKRDHLMFLTRLCVGRHEKLRLRELWNEFKRRGIDFDFESKRQIIILYEKLNMLEKKSDSGDAQYVRAIF